MLPRKFSENAEFSFKVGFLSEKCGNPRIRGEDSCLHTRKDQSLATDTALPSTGSARVSQLIKHLLQPMETFVHINCSIDTPN